MSDPMPKPDHLDNLKAELIKAIKSSSEKALNNSILHLLLKPELSETQAEMLQLMSDELLTR
jgi:hypothetical protein